MSSSKLKEIKAIVRDFDVRDPRGALFAIEQVLKAEVTGKQKPKFRVSVFDDGPFIRVDVDDLKTAKPRHVKCAVKAITQFITEKRKDCDSPVCQAERAAKTGEQDVQFDGEAAFAGLIAGLKASGLNPIVLDASDKDAK